jgi:hypothetical protein
MKKKGAPKSMIKHEMGEMKGMKKGGMTKKMAVGGVSADIKAARAQKAKREADQATYSAANKTRLDATAKQKAAADAVRNERLANPKSVESRMAKESARSNLVNPSLAALNKRMSGMPQFGVNRYDPSSGKNIINVNRKKALTPAEQAYLDQRKTTREVLNKTPENQTYYQRPTAGATKKMASGGLAAGHKSADGIASKGKTKGKMMAKGGIAMKKGKYC